MPDRIVIVRKKKVASHGHHGGSWKVAYADFVTAMMAFFLVMWIMGMDQGVRNMVQGYFENPIGFGRDARSGGAASLLPGGSIVNLELQNALVYRRREDRLRLENTAAHIKDELSTLGLLQTLGAEVDAVVTDQGLRIEMMETGGEATFFDRSSAELKPALRDILRTVAAQIAGLPNGVIVEGHTDAAPFGRGGYSNWELSADRANAARRVLVASGMPADHLLSVRGLADRELKEPGTPLDPRNRRISLLLPYNTQAPSPVDPLTEEAMTDVGAVAGPTGGGVNPGALGEEGSEPAATVGAAGGRAP